MNIVQNKRQIIVENFSNPKQEVSLTKLQEISNKFCIPLVCLRSLNSGCGDTIYLVVKKNNKFVESALFASEQQACCLTIAAANILCSWMEKQKIGLVEQEIINIEKMLKGESYFLDNCLSMGAFGDLKDFPQRLECVNLVIRGVKQLLEKS